MLPICSFQRLGWVGGDQGASPGRCRRRNERRVGQCARLKGAGIASGRREGGVGVVTRMCTILMLVMEITTMLPLSPSPRGPKPHNPPLIFYFLPGPTAGVSC